MNRNIIVEFVSGFVLNGTSFALTPVRATTYTEQTTNFTGSVVSSSANDTSAGTGARTIRITYFDQTGAGPFTEDKSLNGTSATNLVSTDHCFIDKIEVLTAGSTGTNAGTISLFTGAAGAGTLVGTIAVGSIVNNPSNRGDGRTLWAHKYVPLNKTASIAAFSGGGLGNQAAQIYLRVFSPLVPNDVDRDIGHYLTVQASGGYASLEGAVFRVAGFARVTAYVTANGSNTRYVASFSYSEP